MLATFCGGIFRGVEVTAGCFRFCDFLGLAHLRLLLYSGFDPWVFFCAFMLYLGFDPQVLGLDLVTVLVTFSCPF